AAPRRMASLSCVRSPRRHMGGQRRAWPRHSASRRGAVPRTDLHVRSGGLAGLQRRSRAISRPMTASLAQRARLGLAILMIRDEQRIERRVDHFLKLGSAFSLPAVVEQYFREEKM